MLHRPWVAPLVVAFWCVTTGWLAGTKILPAFHAGEAPDEAAWLTANDRLAPVGWSVHWNGSPIGWALNESSRDPDGGTTVRSRLHCDRLPLDEMLPGWAGTLVQRALHRGESTSLDATGRIAIDAAGRLQAFTSTVTLPATGQRVALEGVADGAGEIAVSFHAGDLRYDTTVRVPGHGMVGDELSPQAVLPGLYEGRRWTIPVYSPLRPGRATLQVLHAVVGPEETIFWGDRLVNARVVSYREDPSSPREPRCRVWVDRSGRVLRHESALLGAKMEFVRRTDDEAERLARLAALVDAAAHDGELADDPAEDFPP
ncbi:MAG: hypothetical protein ACKOZU_10170 [Planctomycetaceae bacterium]